MAAVDILLFAAGVIVMIIGWLLAKKDQTQGDEIAALKASVLTLFGKHDIDVAALQELRLQIAREHYQKEELDERFNKLEAAFQRGFDDLGHKFDRLSEALLEHLHDENINQRQQ
jgi:Tfp pilus assembly protein PilO